MNGPKNGGFVGQVKRDKTYPSSKDSIRADLTALERNTPILSGQRGLTPARMVTSLAA
jgi:hypothetical protein